LHAAPRQVPVAFPVAGPGWLAAIAADGKAMRGAIGPDGQVPYLLAAAVHGTGTVIAERLIGPKTSEVPELAPLLRELNQYYCLAGHVITLDALHTVRAHATLIVSLSWSPVTESNRRPSPYHKYGSVHRAHTLHR